MTGAEKTLTSETVYSGKIISVRKDQVRLPDGRTGQREVVALANAVAVVALTENLEVLLVRQYRYPVAQTLLEIPAGKIEKGESALDCARRELEEETGYRALNWREGGSFYTSPGFCNEQMVLFMADTLKPHQTNCDPDEFIEVIAVPLRETREMIKSGLIQDAKTIIGLLTALNGG